MQFKKLGKVVYTCNLNPWEPKVEETLGQIGSERRYKRNKKKRNKELQRKGKEERRKESMRQGGALC